MGIRGTLDEFDSRDLVAVNLAGIYDQVGNSWREPLNAPLPNKPIGEYILLLFLHI